MTYTNISVQDAKVGMVCSYGKIVGIDDRFDFRGVKRIRYFNGMIVVSVPHTIHSQVSVKE